MTDSGSDTVRRRPPRAATGQARGRSSPPDPSVPAPVVGAPSGSLLPFVAIAILFALVAVTLHLSSVVRNTLEEELAARLRISARLAVTELVRDANGPFDPEDPATLRHIEDIRRATAVSSIAFYDENGVLLGGSSSQATMGPAIQRTIRVGAAQGRESADPLERLPERDVAGGFTLLVPLGADAGGGALMTRIDPDNQGGLPAIDFLFQVAKALAGIITAAGFLILVRWVSRGNELSTRTASVAPGSDVGMVLGTVKEVMTTLKDNELEYRDRWTAAEANAESQRRRADVILASITSGLVAFDNAGRVTLFNGAAERLFGIAERNALGRPLDEIFGRDDPMLRFSREILEDLRSPERAEVARPQPNGDMVWLVVTGSVIRDDRRLSVGGVLLIDDVTETRDLREAAGLNDRLTAVGEMSAGIAHEIKNALHSLMGHANLLRDDHGGEEPPLAVRGILDEVRALETMVKGILEFAKPTRLVRTPEDLNQMLEETVRSVGDRASSARVRIELDLDAGLPRTSVDGASVRQVFLNCVLNAVEAMEDGGTLTVTTRPAELGVSGANGVRGEAVRIAFRDTGHGIPDADRQRIFTPFYTTKREGHGLGLALAHRTVTDHGGRLQLHSRENVGTEFVIVLPVGDK